MQAPIPNIAPTKQRPLQTTMDALGYDDTLSWAAQTSSGPDTNLAHYPRLMYYYHPDYLGHVEYITDLDGVPYQYFYYTAPMSRLPTSKPMAQRCFSADWSRPLARWGETLIEEKATRPGMHFESPYRFNAKELDEEPTNGSSRTPLKINNGCEQTGLYYYGARYYNPMVSVWLGVDPLAHKYPSLTPYNYVANNPIYFLDPDGKEGVASVNHNNRTVKIRAVYFVEVGHNGFNHNNFNQLRGLNATLNSLGYTVSDPSSQYNGYVVQFDLQFVPVNSEQRAQSYAHNENNAGNGATDFFVGGFSIGNSMILMTDEAFNANPSINETASTHGVDVNQVMGITDTSLQHIAIPERSRGNILAQLHEIFHTLYYDNDGANEGIGGGREMPNASDINGMINGFQENGRIIEE
jgi:RHS repeat-associated protein